MVEFHFCGIPETQGLFGTLSAACDDIAVLISRHAQASTATRAPHDPIGRSYPEDLAESLLASPSHIH